MIFGLRVRERWGPCVWDLKGHTGTMVVTHRAPRVESKRSDGIEGEREGTTREYVSVSLDRFCVSTGAVKDES